MFPQNATTDFEGNIILQESPVKLNSLFEVKTNVEERAAEAKPRLGGNLN